MDAIREEAKSFVRAAYNAAMATAETMDFGTVTLPEPFASVTVSKIEKTTHVRVTGSEELDECLEEVPTGEVLLTVDFGPCVKTEDIKPLESELWHGAQDIDGQTVTVDIINAGKPHDWKPDPVMFLANANYDPFADNDEVTA